MKRSQNIVLVLIASISISACGLEGDDSSQQRAYSTKEDCLRDWKADRYCEQSRTSGGGGTAIIGGWYGPRYWQSGGGMYATTRGGQVERVAADVPAARGFSSSRSTMITRGGFGGSAIGRFGGS